MVIYPKDPDPSTDLGYITRVVLRCGGDDADGKFVFQGFKTVVGGNRDGIRLVPKGGKKCVGSRLVIGISFKGKWLAIGEVGFESSPTGEDEIVQLKEVEPLEKEKQQLLDRQKEEPVVPKKHMSVPMETTSIAFIEEEEEEEEEEIEIISPTKVPSVPASGSVEDWWESRYLGVAIGILVTVVVLLLIVVVIILHRDRLSRTRTRYSSVSNVSGNSFSAGCEQMYKARLYQPEASTAASASTAVYSEPIFTLKSNPGDFAPASNGASSVAGTNTHISAPSLSLHSLCSNTYFALTDGFCRRPADTCFVAPPSPSRGAHVCVRV